MKRITLMFLVLLLMLSFSACWGTPHVVNVDTDEASNLIQEITSIDVAITEVKIIYSEQSYAPPFLSIDVYFKSNPDQQTIKLVLDCAKKNVTVDAVKKMNKTVDVDVFLRVYTDNNKNKPSVKYATTYYKTNDHTDDSPGNIDGFQTWVQGDLR